MKCTKVLVLLGLLFVIVALVSSEVATQASTKQESIDAGQKKTNAIEEDKHQGGWGGGGWGGGGRGGGWGGGGRGGGWGGGGRGGWGGGRGGGGWGGGSMTNEEDLTVPMKSGQEETNSIEDDKHHYGGWGGGGRGGGWGGGRGGGGGGRGGGGWGGGRGGGGWGGGGSMAIQEDITVPMYSGGGRCSFGCCRQWGGGYGGPRRCTFCRCPTKAEIAEGVEP